MKMTKMFGNIRNIVKYSIRIYSNNVQPITTTKKPWKVLFFGSDEFSLYSLKAVLNQYKNSSGMFSRLEVVTCSQLNPIWKFSKEHKLPCQKWPPDLAGCEYDLGLVVSFGHLIPKQIISKFPLGMLNVHGSLLPRWRGASPIVYALANGDKETGVTIMRIRPNKFDVGEILYQEKIAISHDIEMPELHEQLGKLGAKCLIDTLWNIDERLANSVPQPSEGVTYAPKISPDFAKVKWNTSTAKDLYNLQRALKSIHPLKTSWNSIPVKLFDAEIWPKDEEHRNPGFVVYSKKNKLLLIECANRTWISVKKVGVQGKKIMNAADFHNGFISKVPENTITCFV
ncbi:unnamed protein product [Ceutorhynchus assimilis]|uniref:Methionyl-tRNA formyltransferase, mitochondrial n=1 Tax=Ceutorhynchus assimilis TaxID=467358 RepID=A0A9N9QGE3_9CUCU|nr:unnamed protein product [Ceutorhynchus assimilis]